jgi:hypothetical protein
MSSLVDLEEAKERLDELVAAVEAGRASLSHEAVSRR